MDLAAWLHLKNWSYQKIGLVWCFTAWTLLLIVAMDAYMRNGAWFVFLFFTGQGIFSLFTVTYSEAKGEYTTRGGRYIKKIERSEKFRSQSNIAVFMGVFLTGAGFYFQLWSLYMIFRYGRV